MPDDPQVRRTAARRKSLAAILAVFVISFALLQALAYLAASNGYLDGLMGTTARAAQLLIASAGIPVTLAGNQLVLTNHILQIDPDCTGINIAALYAALVTAYPLSALTRMLALVVGLPVIAVANLLRLLAVGLASEYLSAAAFTFVHDYLFQVAMMLVVVGLWAMWLQMARAHATRS